MVTKVSNPKDRVGTKKVPLSTVSANVIMEVGLAMLEGARKYGRFNYRVAGVLASVYYDAAMRHLMAFYEGQDIDPDSGLSHITKAIACLTVLRDAQINEMWVDDRPPKLKNQNWINDLNKKAGEIIDRYPDSVPPFTEKRITDIGAGGQKTNKSPVCGICFGVGSYEDVRDGKIICGCIV